MEKITKWKVLFCRIILFAIYVYRITSERVQINGYGEAIILLIGFLLGFLLCCWFPRILCRTKKTDKDYDGVLECKTEENGDKQYKFSINIETLDNKKEFLIKYKDVED